MNFFDPHRRHFGKIATLAPVACTCAGGLLASIQAALAEDVALAGIRHISGNVQVNKSPARKGQLIEAGTSINTGADGQVVYVIGQNAYLQQAGSLITHLKGGLRLFSGKLLSVFGKSDNTFSLETPAATIGIRGTGIYTEVKKKGVYACLCYGNVMVAPHKSDAFKLTSGYHKAIQVSTEGTTQNQSMLGHTDDELVMLEALLGRQPAFVKT